MSGGNQCRRQIKQFLLSPGIIHGFSDGKHSGQDPSDIAVNGGNGQSVSDAQDRPRRVIADAGQGEQGLDVAGHDAIVAVADLRRRSVQPERAARVPEVCPHAHRLRGGVGREIGGRRPALEPRGKQRNHA